MEYDSTIRVADRSISLAHPTYFIADIAANHDGDLERAKDLIYLAKEAGADCAKFQHFLADKIVSDFGFKAMQGQQSHQASWKKSVFEVYEQYHFRRDWTQEIVRTCNDAGIDFMTTPYDLEIIDELSELVKGFKIGSGDITWLEEIDRIANTGHPIFLACGASSFTDVERAVERILAHSRQFVLMQCNTNYTADLENFKHINLNVLKTFSVRWPGMVLGLSDHTHGHATVLGAIALGARAIEKHFTDDNSRTGPDHHFAMNPVTWREMVDRSREVEYALGTGIKAVEDNEKETVVIQRRSVRVSNSVKGELPAGTTLERSHLEVLRPCPVDAIAPYDLDQVIGRTLTRSVPAGDHLTWNDLK